MEDVTKLRALPVADESRLDAGFVRREITNAAEALSAAFLWEEANALHIPAAAMTDYAAFVMAMDDAWHVTLCVREETAVLQMDGAGRLLSLTRPGAPELPTYNGFLPRDTYTAIRSYIEHFARLNGCGAVTEVVIWQLDFALRDTGDLYIVHVRDLDGAVMGVWAPEEATG